MMKRFNLLLVIVTTFFIGSCASLNLLDPNIEKHNNTMSTLGTYFVEVVSSKTNTGVTQNTTEYIYIDNDNDTFLLTNQLKDTFEIYHEDVVFEMEEDKLYSYIFEDKWSKYEVSDSYLSLKNIEHVLFAFFTDAEVQNTNFEIVYTDTLTMNDLKGKITNILDLEIDQDLYDQEFSMSAVYSKNEERFISFTFDLTEQMILSDYEETFYSSDAAWTLTLDFKNIDQEFHVLVDEFIEDDYYNDFTHKGILEFDEKYSYELIKGTVNYESDQDILTLIFDKTGLYKLMLKDINTLNDLVVTIMDEQQNVVRTLTVSAHDNFSNYWNFSKGTYYICIESIGSSDTPTNYSFLFITN